jgi:hypothetical protein
MRIEPLISLSPAFTLVSFSAYSSTLKVEAICSSETLNNHRCENLKLYISMLVQDFPLRILSGITFWMLWNKTVKQPVYLIKISERATTPVTLLKFKTYFFQDG